MREIRSQQMAKHAYDCVVAMQVAPLKEKYFPNDDKKASSLSAKYRTLALNFPSMILQSSLSQSIGFLLAKGKEEHLELLAHLATLLEFSNGENLHEHILQTDLAEYQLLTRKALDASTCLKRYTQALLESEKDKGKANE